MKFIVDTQLPPSLSTFLKNRGHDCVHTTDFPEGQLMKDEQIRKLAFEQDRIIITKDSDFFDHFIVKGAPPKVLLIELGNVGNKTLLSVISANLDAIIQTYEKSSSSLIILQEKNLLAY
ncbi:MAG: DUF5615 family PIN-like protein [Bacteroidetes bacterium]|nr:DUF5615 family PIN-like protein [Bacteroidota bacterium]